MITCIVQARMGSTRLKGKVLKEVLGLPLVLITLKRLQKSKYIDKIILATSDLCEDDELYNVVRQAGFDVFRGDEQDVLKRYVNCIEKFGGETIVRVTGDCPLIDPIIVDNVICNYFMYGYDYIRLDVPNTFIRGFDVEVFSKEAIMRTDALSYEPKYREHVTLYIYNHLEQFSVGSFNGSELYNKQYRLCVDTIEDFELISKIFNHFSDIYVSGLDVVKYLDQNLEVAQINQSVIQKHY